VYTVYILRSLKDTKRHYIGITVNLEKRLKEHNNKQSTYSGIYAPWKLETCIVFKDKILAENFEAYLKHGSGNAFLKKRLIGAK
jgi:predicted GIY-YIG superfamily endonuclease